jgi:hypothetical protein
MKEMKKEESALNSRSLIDYIEEVEKQGLETIEERHRSKKALRMSQR